MKTSKKASTHMWITIHLQKSAITKLVSGFAIKPLKNKSGMPITEYKIQLGKFQFWPLVKAGFIPQILQKPKERILPLVITDRLYQNQQTPIPDDPANTTNCLSDPKGPMTMPRSEPPTRINNKTNNKLTSFFCPGNSFWKVWVK